MITLEKCLKNFNTYYEVNDIDHEDVAIRMLVKNVIDATLNWYNSLPKGSITSWDDLARTFLIRFKSRIQGT